MLEQIFSETLKALIISIQYEREKCIVICNQQSLKKINKTDIKP